MASGVDALWLAGKVQEMALPSTRRTRAAKQVASVPSIGPRATVQKLGHAQPMSSLSPRLAAIVDALPLRPGMRVLEIGCGPGVAAREVARRLRGGHVLGIDRSKKAIALARAGSKAELASGRLSFRGVAIEDFELASDDSPFDLAFAIRVGALDGRHPDVFERACDRIAAALKPRGKLLIDGGAPLRLITLSRAHRS